MNKFDQLVEDLKDGKLTLTHIQIAYRAYLRESKHLPDALKDILGGRSDKYSGVHYKIFRLLKEVEGTVELAYNRGVQVGREEKE